MQPPKRQLHLELTGIDQKSPFNEFRKVVLPILVKYLNGDIECVGSCFLIWVYNQGTLALAITAKHIVDHIYTLDRQKPFGDSHFERMFGAINDDLIPWKNIEVFTIVYDGQCLHPYRVHNFTTFVEGCDLAIARLKSPPDVSFKVSDPLKIASKGPVDGIKVIALGYSVGKVSNEEYCTSGLLTKAALNTGLKSVPAITNYAIASSEPHQVKGPCFALKSGQIESGMSGGPVVYQDYDGFHWIACGMISWSSDIRDFAISSILLPILKIPLGKELIGLDCKDPALEDLVIHGGLNDVSQT
jgi:hypothetical protein